MLNMSSVLGTYFLEEWMDSLGIVRSQLNKAFKIWKKLAPAFWLCFDWIWAAPGIHPAALHFPLTHCNILTEWLAILGPPLQKGSDRCLNFLLIVSFICSITTSHLRQLQRKEVPQFWKFPFGWDIRLHAHKPNMIVISLHSHNSPAKWAGQGQPCHHVKMSNDLPKFKGKKVTGQGLESRSFTSMTSPVWTLLYRFAKHLGKKVHPDTQIWNPARSAVGSALISWPKPHPPRLCFSDVFCNVILIFTALGQTSRLCSLSGHQLPLTFSRSCFFSSSAFFFFHFIFISGNLPSSKLAVSVTSVIPFWRMAPIFPGMVLVSTPSRKKEARLAFLSPITCILWSKEVFPFLGPPGFMPLGKSRGNSD